MDSQASHSFESQGEEDNIVFSQASLSQPTYYPYSHPSFPIPPHGYQAMLTPSLSPTQPFAFRPPSCGLNANGTSNSSCLPTRSPLEFSQTKFPRGKSMKRKEDRQGEGQP
ncbi:hypothetical protein KP509_07G050800 [Ceratopteris richardii]|uniref:Uncharacterized protein n=1 Tax=Ceratopteris richardii TaxID=49495 RepID=A0A8T2UI68_CERRI|nr:hypothetical protein KP509_07G050800 [Ceratopteris richardii]